MATAWRDPSGTVAIMQLHFHEDWVGRPVTELEEATGSRVAFIMRFGTGVLPRRDTVLQAEDEVYMPRSVGTVAAVTAAAAAAPEEG